MNKSGGTRIIAIGNVVADFLKGRDLCERVEKVLHYSPQAAAHIDKKIEPWRNHFPKFSQSVDKVGFEESIKAVLCDAGMDSYIGSRPVGPKPPNLTESRKKLMFYYKNRFAKLRNVSHIVVDEARLRRAS